MMVRVGTIINRVVAEKTEPRKVRWRFLVCLDQGDKKENLHYGIAEKLCSNYCFVDFFNYLSV